jgi:hypothetical protein
LTTPATTAKSRRLQVRTLRLRQRVRVSLGEFLKKAVYDDVVICQTLARFDKVRSVGAAKMPKLNVAC